MPQRRQKSTIQNQILFIFLLSVILPVWLIGSFSIVRARSQMLEHYFGQVQADCVRVNSILFDTTTSLYTALDPLINSHSFMAFLGQQRRSVEQKQQYEIWNETLSTIYKNTAAISSLKVYTDNPYIKIGQHFSYVSDFQTQTWYRYLPENGWQGWVFLPNEDQFGNPLYELCLIRRTGVISDKYSAYIVLCVDNNYLKNRLEQNQYHIMTALENGPVFYASDAHLVNTQMAMPEDFRGGYYKYTGPCPTYGKNALTDIRTFQAYKTNDKFYIAVSDDSAYTDIRKITLMYLLIMLIASLVPSIIIAVFSHYFSSRIKTLRFAMHQASLGDYNIVNTFRGDDELSDTFADLKKAIENIKEKEALYYTAQLNEQRLINKQQQMEFNMLAGQINPHFLYNTLETIRVQALSHECRDVASSISLLGKSMRYVLENTGTSTTSLKKELDYIKTYLAIQKLRFGERVNAAFDIPEAYDTDAIEILPLLLQPIVENTIVHGLEDIYGEGLITITVRINDDLLLITIADNGVGMDSETLATVREKLDNHPDNAKSIGLYNINQRIKLFYGSGCQMQIESRQDEGTTVTLTLACRYFYKR